MSFKKYWTPLQQALSGAGVVAVAAMSGLWGCSGEMPAASAVQSASTVSHTYLVELSEFRRGVSPRCLRSVHNLVSLRRLYDSHSMFYARADELSAARLRSLSCVSSVIEVAERPYLVELTDVDSEVHPQCLAHIKGLTELSPSGYSRRNFEMLAAEFVAYEVAQLDCVARVSVKPITSFFDQLLNAGRA